MHIPPRTKRFFVKTFHMEEGSITDTEIGRRHHPKLFGKYRNSIWSKFYKTRYLATPCHCHCKPKCTCCQSQPIGSYLNALTEKKFFTGNGENLSCASIFIWYLKTSTKNRSKVHWLFICTIATFGLLIMNLKDNNGWIITDFTIMSVSWSNSNFFNISSKNNQFSVALAT